MAQQIPVRLNASEETLIAQVRAAGGDALADQLQARGLPTRKVEAYHYTDLKSLIGSVPPVSTEAAAVGSPELRLAGAYRLLVTNGEAGTVGTAPNGIELAINQPGQALPQRDDVIVELNRALTRDRVIDLTLTGSVDPVVHLDYRAAGTARHFGAASRIRLAPRASATVLETISGSNEAHLVNLSSKIDLGAGSKLLHVIVQEAGSASRTFHTQDYDLAEGATLTTLVINVGAGLNRTQIFARFGGAEAHADFGGLALLDSKQHCDVTLNVEHAVPHTTSTELFKSVVRGDSVSAFQGRIVVAPDAQKTDAKMMSQGLLLADDAQILTKPELEIFADDVQCGHGATCGDLDEDALFYLMSRGIPRSVAEGMLTRAFVQELLDQIEDEEFHEMLAGVVDEWLEAGQDR